MHFVRNSDSNCVTLAGVCIICCSCVNCCAIRFRCNLLISCTSIKHWRPCVALNFVYRYAFMPNSHCHVPLVNIFQGNNCVVVVLVQLARLTMSPSQNGVAIFRWWLSHAFILSLRSYVNDDAGEHVSHIRNELNFEQFFDCRILTAFHRSDELDYFVRA